MDKHPIFNLVATAGLLIGSAALSACNMPPSRQEFQSRYLQRFAESSHLKASNSVDRLDEILYLAYGKLHSPMSRHNLRDNARDNLEAMEAAGVTIAFGPYRQNEAVVYDHGSRTLMIGQHTRVEVAAEALAEDIERHSPNYWTLSPRSVTPTRLPERRREYR